MTNLAGFVVALTLASPAAGAFPVPNDLLYEELADRWLERQGYDRAKAMEVGLEALIDARLTTLRWGALDVRIPPEALADRDLRKDIAGALAALLEAQTELVRWLAGPEAEIDANARAAVETLEKWLKGWKPRLFEDADALRGRELLEALGADDKVADAADAFRAYLLRGGPLEREAQLRPARLIFQPERENLVEFACVVGLLRPPIRGLFWVEGLHDWTMFDIDGTRVVGMEYAGPQAAEDYRDAIPMDARNRHALNEHVVQLGVRALLETISYGRMEPALAAGLANDMVITLYGEVDTRSDGDLRSRQSHGRSVFIPGANPNGGTLPATNADSRWRVDRGKGHFTRLLKAVQKQGAKKGRTQADKLGRFRLMNDDQSEKLLVQAPFLGPAAQTPPPDAFYADYAEFLRAYRAAFLFWLRTEAAGDDAESKERFAELMRKLTDPREGRDLAQLFQDVYGRGLSAASPEELFESDCLEGDFLVWLSRS